MKVYFLHFFFGKCRIVKPIQKETARLGYGPEHINENGNDIIYCGHGSLDLALHNILSLFAAIQYSLKTTFFLFR